MALIILRCTFVAIAMMLGAWIINSGHLTGEPLWYPWVVFAAMVLSAVVIIGFDLLIKSKNLPIISAVYFGFLVGLLLAYVAVCAIDPLLTVSNVEPFIRQVINSVLTSVLCYICISLLIQTRDEFRFIIPYVEFSKETKGLKPMILDTSVIIDGRIADVIDTQLLDNPLIMPRFVIAELQAIADSSDKTRRTRGRRGLDILNRLRSNPKIDLSIYDKELPEFDGEPVDQKLVLLAKNVDGKVVTNDFNLNKVAQLHGVEVVNLNELANALKPQYTAGEEIKIQIMKVGEGPHQGIGYLDDGTMIVVEGGRDHIDQVIDVTVTSVLQTNAGRMIFGRC